MMKKKAFKGRSRKMIADLRDSSPLRKDFLANNDSVIEKIVKDYFVMLKEKVWNSLPNDSYLEKTVGIQALFQLLKESLKRNEVLTEAFYSKLKKIDFSDNYFQASGIGKTRIKKVLFVLAGFLTYEELRDSTEKEDIKRIIGD